MNDNDVTDLYVKYRDKYKELQDRFVRDIQMLMKRRNLYLKPVVRKKDKIYGMLTVVTPKSPFADDYEGNKFLESSFMEVGLFFSSLGVSDGVQPLIEEFYSPHDLNNFDACTEGELQKWL